MELSEQFSRFAHLPAVDGGQRILQVLDRLEYKIDRLEGKVDELEHQVVAVRTPTIEVGSTYSGVGTLLTMHYKH